ncbi:gem-associated protein 4-like [Diadema setosum]|uniref:gem-associated protein 4-like n=1 Tax=Diadema setosum TaxID=31175 RepID=UPI003B3AA26D
MIAFFQGCCISVEVRDLFFQDLPKTLLARSSQDFYQAVCLALCQVLPSCTMSEWQAVRGTLEQLIVDEVLDTAYSTEFVAGLPMFDMTVYRCPLLLCQIFTTTIQFLTNHKVCQFDWMIPQVWHQAVKNYAHIMKDILNLSADIYANNLLDAAGLAPSAFLFVIGQLFCHSCKVAGCVPPSSSELLFVWCLELVSQAADLMTRHPGDSSLSNAARQQAKTLCSVLSWMPGSEHQAMLQLKIYSLLADVR